MMKKFAAGIALSVALSASAAFAQSDSKPNAALKSPHTVNDGSARSGANSFTQNEARKHIAHSGFTSVSALTKDSSGIWRGTAVKGNSRVKVAVDYKGNVSTGD